MLNLNINLFRFVLPSQIVSHFQAGVVPRSAWKCQGLNPEIFYMQSELCGTGDSLLSILNWEHSA